jgi:hypothetical protein
MKRNLRILLFCLILALASFANAKDAKISFWGGYTAASIDEVNKSLTSLALTLDDKSITEVNSGIMFGVDIDAYKINKNIIIGPRLGYISFNKGKASGKLQYTQTEKRPFPNIIEGGSYPYTITDNQTINNTLSCEYSFSLIPVLFGGKYTKNISNKINLTGLLYAGIGFGRAKLDSKIETTVSHEETVDVPSNVNVGYPKMYTDDPIIASDSDSVSESGFMADLGFSVEYIFTDKISTLLSLGYRIASDIGEVDFSGMTATAGLNYKF